MSGVTEDMIASARTHNDPAGAQAPDPGAPGQGAAPSPPGPPDDENILTAKAMAGHVGVALAADWLQRQCPGVYSAEAATAAVTANGGLPQ